VQSSRDPNAKARRLRHKGAKQETGTGVMIKTIYAVAAAAIVAACFVAFLGFAMEVEARAQLPGAKADRADTRPLANTCSQRAWPYFEAGCLRDARNTFGQARIVRVVAADRVTVAAAGSPR